MELANAYVTIVPSLRGAQRQITDQLSGVDTTSAGATLGADLSAGMTAGLNMQSVGAKIQSVGNSISDLGGKLTSHITVPALGAAAAVGGMVAALGFQRLVGIDTARGQFKGLGYDVEAVMAQVSAGVQDTALAMADGASIAVSALAATVPLENLEKHLKRVANVSAAYGVEASHAGAMLNQAYIDGTVTYGLLSQMQSNSIPVISALADEYGKTGAEIQAMAQNGEISIDMLNQALDSKAGAAAEAYAGTWRGITANIRSNLGRIGAEALGPVFDVLKTEAAGLLDVLRSPEFTESAASIGESIAGALQRIISGIKSAITWWSGLSTGTQKAILMFAGFAVAAGPVISIVGRLVTGIGGIVRIGGTVLSWFGGMGGAAKGLGVALRFLTGPVGLIVTAIGLLVASSPELQDALMEIATIIGGALMDVVKALVPLFEQLATEVFPLVAEIATMLGGLLAAIVPIIGELINAFMPLIMLLVNTLLPIVQTVFAAIVPIIEAAMKVIQGVIKVFTSLIKGDWEGVWDGIKMVLEGTWDFIVSVVEGAIAIVWSVIEGTLAVIVALWEDIWSEVSGFFTGIWTGIVDAATGFFNGVKDVFNDVMTFIGDIPGKIKGFFSGIGTWLLDSGKALVNGFLNGIKNAWSTLTGWVSDGLQAVRDLFPFSPAKAGPFSGRGWVYHSGMSLGATFGDAVADSLRDSRAGIVDELDAIDDEFDRITDREFRVKTAVPFDPSVDGATGSGVHIDRVEIVAADNRFDVEELRRQLAMQGV